MHPQLAAHLENLGLVFFLGGFEDSNTVVLKQALAIRRAMLADDNPAIGRFEGKTFDPAAWKPRVPTAAFLRARADDSFVKQLE